MLRENYRKRECLLLGEKGKKQYYRMYPAGHNSKIYFSFWLVSFNMSCICGTAEFIGFNLPFQKGLNKKKWIKQEKIKGLY